MLFRSVQGKSDEAKPLLERAIAIGGQTASEHPDHANILNNFAYLLTVQGKYDKARRLFERALVILQATLGADHPRTQRVSSTLAALPFNARDRP